MNRSSKWVYAWTATVLCALVAGTIPAAEIELRVTGNRVSLRAAPDGEAEIVGQVSSGDMLYTRKLEGDWIPVLPPPDVDLWVYGQLVKDETVAVPTLRVRSGPGINYRPVGLLERGTRLQVRDVRGDWVLIEPPADCVLWISRRYVKRATPPAAPAATPAAVASVEDPTPAPRPAPPPPSTPSPVPARQPVRPASRVEPAPAPPALPVRPVARRFPSSPASPVSSAGPAGADASARLPQATPTLMVRPPPFGRGELVASKPQGRAAKLSGTLRRAAWVWRRPSRYRLVESHAAGPATTACYVVGDPDELAANEGRPVVVRGKSYWLQGVRHPVVVVGL